MMERRHAALGSLSLGLFVLLGAGAIGVTEQSCRIEALNFVAACDGRGDLNGPTFSAVRSETAHEAGRSSNASSPDPTETAVSKPGESRADANISDHSLLADEAASAMAAALANDQGGTRSGRSQDAAQLISRAERDAFRLAIQDCWDFDPRSPAGRSAVTVGFHLDRSGRVSGTVERVWHDAPSPEAAEQAYQAASRAILDCQDEVVLLTPASRDQERRAELTFEARTWAIR